MFEQLKTAWKCFSCNLLLDNFCFGHFRQHLLQAAVPSQFVMQRPLSGIKCTEAPCTPQTQAKENKQEGETQAKTAVISLRHFLCQLLLHKLCELWSTLTCI